jgi:glycosyltransferase involved in cell wall biosynthesis
MDTVVERRRVEQAQTAKLERFEIAVLVPCYNEEATIDAVVRGFRQALPSAMVYVYDNASTDRTREVASAAGAIVRMESHRGKGNVVRRMFADIEADIYVMVDGDNTYDAMAAPRLVNELIESHLDMVNGSRMANSQEAYRRGHKLGNRLLTSLVGSIFGDHFQDMLSGYRVFSRRFVKSFPALAAGFEIETELTVHALELRMPVKEIITEYRERPEGSVSKLKTYSDGLRILRTIVTLIKEERPLQFFFLVFTVLASLSVLLALPLILEYVHTGLVPRFPTAILATGLMLLSFLSLFCGLILDTVARGRREARRMAYLCIPTVPVAFAIRRTGRDG